MYGLVFTFHIKGHSDVSCKANHLMERLYRLKILLIRLLRKKYTDALLFDEVLHLSFTVAL